MAVPFAKMVQGAYGNWYKICPMCEARILCVERKDFESFTGIEYVEHVRIVHPEKYGIGIARSL